MIALQSCLADDGKRRGGKRRGGKRRGFRHSVLAAASALAVVAMMGTAWAQTQRLPGVIEKKPAEVPAGVAKQPLQVQPGQPTPAEVARANEVVATLTGVKFSGVTVFNESDLQAIAAPYLNRPVTRGEIAQLKFDVSKLYFDKGYILVRVVTPPQNLANGILDIQVFEARIGKIDVRNVGVLRPFLVRALTGRLKSGEVFREAPVESTVNDINDLGNVGATLNLQPGEEVGTTDLTLNIKPARDDTQQVSADNYGSELTGKRVAAVSLEKSNLFRMGESLNADFDVTDEGTWTAQGIAKLPIGIRNIKLDLRYVHSDIDVGGRLAALDATGKTDIAEAGFSSVLLNMRRRRIELRTGLQARQHRSFLAGAAETDDDIRQVFVEGAYTVHYPSAIVYGFLRGVKGVGILGASKQGDVGNTRSEGDPDVWMIQPFLYVNLRPNPRGVLKAQVSGQWASNTVLSSDLFVLGGYNSIRGFEPAESTGDSGMQFSVQYDHEFFNGKAGGFDWKVKGGPFVDGGIAFNRQAGAVSDDHLYSVGLGLELSSNFTKVGESKLRFDVAWPVGDYNSSTVDANTLYLRLVQTF